MILRVIGDASCDFFTRILPFDVQKLLIFLDFLSSSRDFTTPWLRVVRSSVMNVLSLWPFSFVLLANTLLLIL